MDQDRIFSDSEGDRWFQRNKAALNVQDHIDWPCYLIDLLGNKSGIRSILELGCSNGYRLHTLFNLLGIDCRCVGVDASKEAVRDGKERHPELELHQGTLSAVPLQGEFDLVIVNFVLHWVDRKALARSLSEIDRLIKNDGFLILGDFLPDHQQRRRYHHLPNETVYTYKQDYAKTFVALGTYQEITKITYNHDTRTTAPVIMPSSSSARAVCSVLHKSLAGYYPEV